MSAVHPTLATALVLVTACASPDPSEEIAAVRGEETVPPEECPRPDDLTTGLDPGSPGPYGAWQLGYDVSEGGFHPEVFLPELVPIEERGELYFPAEAGCGPFPVVLIMHGGHATCYESDAGVTGLRWPCPPELPEAYPSYRGFDYLGLRLASQGFIVASISANGTNAFGNDQARAELFERHLDLLAQMNTSNLWFGGLLVGRIDLDRVGVLGHSRGGAGATRYTHLNAAGSPYGLKAAMLLGSAVGAEASIAPDVAAAMLLPYCDGDQQTLPSVQIFDHARYANPGDTAPRYTIEVMGANHNFFNTTWDPSAWPFLGSDDVDFPLGIDDEICNGGTAAWPRLSASEQRATLVAYASAFFRVHLMGDTRYRRYLTGDAPPPPSASSQNIMQAYHPPDLPTHRRAIHRVDELDADVVNSLGGAVTSAGSVEASLCDHWGAGPTGCLAELAWSPGTSRTPHAQGNVPPLQMRLGWTAGGAAEPAWRNEIPAGPAADFTSFAYLQFRAFVDFQDHRNPFGAPQDLSLQLTDGAGQTARVPVSGFTRSLFFPPSFEDPRLVSTMVPRAVLNSVRVPLASFASQVLLNDIREVALVFDRTPAGAIVVTDLLLADPAPNLAPAVACTLADDTLPPSGNLIDVGLEVTVTDPDDAAPATTALAVFSDQDDLQQGAKPDAAIFGDTVQLRGERDPALGGRVYVVVAHASDGAGALGYGCCAATVPQGDPTTADRAAAALDQCTAFMAAAGGGLAPPSGFFAVGE